MLIQRRSNVLGMLFLLFVSIGTAACDSSEAEPYAPSFTETLNSSKNVFVLGVHPLHNPERLHQIFAPLADYLSSNIPQATFKIEASRNYAAFDEKLYAGKFEFALPNPYQTVNALKKGYRVFGKMGDDDNFRGIILVRKDSGITKPSDLKGKAMSFPAPTALAATMLPQYFLQSHGVDVMRDIDIRYVGSQESSIMNVYLGNVAAAATWPPPWKLLSKERPALSEELHPIWQTPSLPNNGLVFRTDVPSDVVNQVGRLLFALNTHDEGQKILKAMHLSRFEQADNSTYQPVVEFLQEFSRDVRQLK